MALISGHGRLRLGSQGLLRIIVSTSGRNWPSSGNEETEFEVDSNFHSNVDPEYGGQSKKR
jgi:hypothetical protein